MLEQIHISIGELWDKFTILLIKKDKINDEDKKKHVLNEIKVLATNMDKYSYYDHELFIELKEINLALWDIEDKLRIKELEQCFDDEFVLLARSVYTTNDKRAEIKHKINTLYGSSIFEVKDYVKYNA